MERMFRFFAIFAEHYSNIISEIKELAAKIQEAYEAFVKDAVLRVEHNDEAAGFRARKVSLAAELMMKDFRKRSSQAVEKEKHYEFTIIIN